MNRLEQISELIDNPFPDAGLTPRETDVVRLVTQGHDQRTVGDMLGVKRSTVKTLVARAKEKIGRESSDWTPHLIDRIKSLANGQLEGTDQ